MKFFLLIIFFAVTLLYIPLNRQAPKYRLKFSIDDQIPLMPWTVWIYAAYYPLIPLTLFFTWNSPVILPLLICLNISTIFSSLVWKIFPNGVARPTISRDLNINHRVLSLIYSKDRDCNGLPSGHVIHSFIATYFLSLQFPNLWLVFLVILMSISISTLTTKQHYYIDMVATLFTAPLMVEFTKYII